MCGIIGYIGHQQASHIIIEGLKRLEYRGYDSAGIAVINGSGVGIRRVEGKLAGLEVIVKEQPLKGEVGIGHTRWATHGRPTETNAHPHCFGDIVVVHNGIIENHNELKQFLMAEGHQFESETDTEVICHLVQHYLRETQDTFKALNKTLKTIRGSYALALINEKEKDRMYIAREGSPLVVGSTEGETFVASDIPAILPYTKKMIFLEDGDVGIVSSGGVKLFKGEGAEVKRKQQHIPWSPQMAERGGYKHFMLKEIYEQTHVFEDTLAGRVLVEKGIVRLDELDMLCGKEPFPFDEILIIACGTSLHAGMVGKYLIESLARVRVMVDLASEFRYRKSVINAKTLVIPITQSGETADTLAAAQMMKEAGAKVLPLCNVVGSTITRMADATLYTHAGPEIGVASTKAFTTQLTVLLLLALDIARRCDRIDHATLIGFIHELLQVPRQMKELLGKAPHIREIAEIYSSSKQAIFVGRGMQYPVALEGALKLKEISYLHAEGFAAGELKHGPIALIDNGVPVIAVALQDEVYEKMLSNIEEVKARGADVIALATEGDAIMAQSVRHVISIPKVNPCIAPLLTALPLQLFAYYVADHKGTDIDQPRNLAKSVTVE